MEEKRKDEEENSDVFETKYLDVAQWRTVQGKMLR
jgi:hypothetical protein